MAFVPGWDPQHPLFAPYVHRDGDQLILHSLATPEYDYPSQEWFRVPVERDSSYWSEPYIDTGGGEVLMTTFSRPIKDKDGNIAAILTADLFLDWLSDLMENIQVYPNAKSLMISRTGRFMLSNTRELIMQQTVRDVIEEIRDHDDFKELERAMLAGESGNQVLKYRGKKSHVFYAPIQRTGWSMSIVIPEDDIFGGVRRIGMLINLLQLLGLLMLIVILRSFVRSQYKYKELERKRDRIQSELQIARGIQMSMVPKVFPAYPERIDLDMAATLIPAKEVGGDLYDFFIRDEKLFFCIGDVSGKGIPASLVMAVTRTAFRTVSAHEDRPEIIVKEMNNRLSDKNENDMFVTFFCGVLDLENGILNYCNAGHNPPLILTDAIRHLPVHANIPLGILQGMDFIGQEIEFHFDDALFLYTDGITEAENALHEQFGEERMEVTLHGRKSAADHLTNMKETVAKFVNGAPQSDDLTMLFLHYLGHGKPYVRSLVLNNDLSQIGRLSDFIDGIAQEKGLAMDVATSINLALEEAVVNVINYAYPEGTEGLMDIEVTEHEGVLTITLIDSGRTFDPTAQGKVDITAGLEDRPIGGLGIHLIRTIMDKLVYERKGGKNILTMNKLI
jgi:sigma-B regulation protein RsbU (phosphoserine phosphatase)